MKYAIICFSLFALDCNSPISQNTSMPQANKPSFTFEPIHIKTMPSKGPEYPAKAKAAHIDGVIPVYIHVSETGQIIRIYSDQGPELLRKAAEDYASQFTFTPAKLNGIPTTARYTLNVVFNLKD